MIKKQLAIATLVILSCLLILTSCSKEVNLPLASQQYNSEAEYHEALLSNFVKTNLLGEFGVYTNYLDNEQAAEVATGHEVLSESSGLLLRYYAREHDKKAFDSLWKQTFDTFNMESGFSYRYSPLHEKQFTTNSTVDDLRIIRSLLEAYDSFNEQHYKDKALQYGQRFLQYNVSGNQMFNFYDHTYHLTNQFINLSYIDLKTLSLLSEELHIDPLVDEMLEISKVGYISDDFPFYETRYIYELERYQSEHINTIESLNTILSLAEMGEQNDKSIAFIKEKVANEQLFGQYALDGTALNDVQSTAIYALTAMIGSQVGDEVLVDKSIELMQKFLILDKEHELFGAYGNPETLQLYSYDNLKALLAYSY